jgi:excisionase family DNA binding protein
MLENKLYTMKEASKFLSVHPDTLRRWEKSGHIKSIRIGARRDRRYTKETIEEIISHKT